VFPIFISFLSVSLSVSIFLYLLSLFCLSLLHTHLDYFYWNQIKNFCFFFDFQSIENKQFANYGRESFPLGPLVSLYQSLSFTTFLSLSLSLSLSLCLSLFFSLCLSLSLFVSLCFSLSLFVSLNITSQFLEFYFVFFQSIENKQFANYGREYFSLCPFIPLCQSIYLSSLFSLSLSLSLSHTHTHTHI
jgi:hypothetical protein